MRGTPEARTNSQGQPSFVATLVPKCNVDSHRELTGYERVYLERVGGCRMGDSSDIQGHNGGWVNETIVGGERAAFEEATRSHRSCCVPPDFQPDRTATRDYVVRDVRPLGGWKSRPRFETTALPRTARSYQERCKWKPPASGTCSHQ